MHEYSDSLSLSGIRVLDLTRVLAGPLCAMTLGDLGADVIKVERPGEGDESRGWGPPFDEAGRSAYYLSINRNKLSIAADFDRPEDRDLIQGLAAEADVIIDNFRLGTLERRGLDFAALVETRGVVWCTITGFGAASTRPGYDFVVQAESGWMSITGDPAGDPIKAGLPLADIVAGKDATIAILAALASRVGGRGPHDRKGRRIIISLLDSARAALGNVAQDLLVAGGEAGRWGNAHPNLVPYQLFHAQDRSVVIAVGSDQQWIACARALGLDELAADPRLSTNAGRIANRSLVVGAMADAVVRLSSAEVRERMDAAGVPSGVVLQVTEAIAGTSASALTGMPSSVGGAPRLAPPLLDEHGAVIRQKGWAAFR